MFSVSRVRINFSLGSVCSHVGVDPAICLVKNLGIQLLKIEDKS